MRNAIINFLIGCCSSAVIQVIAFIVQYALLER